MIKNNRDKLNNFDFATQRVLKNAKTHFKKTINVDY